MGLRVWFYVIIWSKCQKMAEILGFAPYSELKNAKNGGFLRVCGCFVVGGAVFRDFFGGGVGDFYGGG